MLPFKYTVKKIKDAAHKNRDVDGTCKRSLRNTSTHKNLYGLYMGFWPQIGGCP